MSHYITIKKLPSLSVWHFSKIMFIYGKQFYFPKFIHVFAKRIYIKSL